MTADVAAQASGATIGAVFDRAFRLYADRVAVTSEADTAGVTYRELGRRADALAAALTELGVRKGDRVAVLSETRPEYVQTYAALSRLGVAVVTLNIRLHPDELADCAGRANPVALLASGGLAEAAASLRDRVPSIRHWVCFDPVDGFTGYSELLASASGPPPAVDIAPTDLHNVLYTSGTTGRPKGAMISQGAAAVRGLRLAQWFGLGCDDGFVGWLPLFHCGGDESLYATVLTGGTYATLRKADAETMFRMIERDRLTWTLLLPGVLTDFLHHPRRPDHDLSTFRFAIGYANMMPGVVEQLTTSCGIDFSDAFGQTETSYLLAHGWCLPGETPSLRKQPTPLLDVRLVDADGDDVADGQPGECVVRGPSVMSGYLDDPEATAEVFDGGWLHTGDVLARGEDGTLTFVDRAKYLIKTGGENVYPAEVELAVASHDAVQEVCVFGVPDEHWGEAVKAVVVRRPDRQVTGQQIVAWCRERLAAACRTTSGCEPAMIEIAGRDEGPVRILAVDRPDRLNAMAPSTVVELEERLRVAEADPGVGAVVLTGVGQHFSAGGDAHAILDVMADEDEAAPLRLMRAFHHLIETVWNSELPVLGAVSGVAYGGGFNLALARAVEWGTQLAGGPRFAVSLTKKLINGSTTGDLYSSLELEAVSQTAAVRGRAAREGFERFVRRDDRASKPASGTSS